MHVRLVEKFRRLVDVVCRLCSASAFGIQKRWDKESPAEGSPEIQKYRDVHLAITS